MNATTTTLHQNEYAGHESHYFGRVQASAEVSHAATAETPDLSPAAFKYIYLTLLGGVVFLALNAAYVWHGYFLWIKNQ